MNEDLLKYNMTAARPLPGQSLTDDPEDRGDWENPPEFTSVEKASEYLFDYIIEDERYEGFMDSLENGFTIMELSQIILFDGFRKGKWNPDLMLLLIEPTAYMLMGLAERVNIDYDVDEDDPEDQEYNIRATLSKARVDKLNKAVGKADTKMPENLKEKLEEVPEAKSLLEK